MLKLPKLSDAAFERMIATEKGSTMRAGSLKGAFVIKPRTTSKHSRKSAPAASEPVVPKPKALSASR